MFPLRHGNDQIVPALARFVFSGAVTTAVGAVVLLVAEVQKSRKLRVGGHDHTSPVSPVATGRTAARHALLPPIGFGARSPRSSVDIDDDTIDEHHRADLSTLPDGLGQPKAFLGQLRPGTPEADAPTA